MKVYIAICAPKNWSPEFTVHSTREAAEKSLAANVGEYILSCIKDDDVAAAIDYIKNATCHKDDDGNVEFYTFHSEDDYYIEEKELDKF